MLNYQRLLPGILVKKPMVDLSGVRLRCGGPHPAPSGATSPTGHQELPGNHAGTAGQGALDRDLSIFLKEVLIFNDI